MRSCGDNFVSIKCMMMMMTLFYVVTTNVTTSNNQRVGVCKNRKLTSVLFQLGVYRIVVLDYSDE